MAWDTLENDRAKHVYIEFEAPVDRSDESCPLKHR